MEGFHCHCLHTSSSHIIDGQGAEHQQLQKGFTSYGFIDMNIEFPPKCEKLSSMTFKNMIWPCFLTGLVAGSQDVFNCSQQTVDLENGMIDHGYIKLAQTDCAVRMVANIPENSWIGFFFDNRLIAKAIKSRLTVLLRSWFIPQANCFIEIFGRRRQYHHHYGTPSRLNS